MKPSIDKIIDRAVSAPDNVLCGGGRPYLAILAKLPGTMGPPPSLPPAIAPRIENPSESELALLVSLYQQSWLEEAHARASALVAHYPNGEILHNIAGAISAALGRVDEAIARFKRALALAPEFAEAHVNLGNALKDSNRPGEALASYDRAIHAMPAYAAAHLNRGIALRMLGRLEEAIESYAAAIRLDPTLAEAHNNRGNALLDQQRPDEAIRDYEAAVRLKTGDAALLGSWLHRLAYMCRWSDTTDAADRSLAALEEGAPHPFQMLRVEPDAARQLAYTRRWAEARYGTGRPAAFAPAVPGAKIRIGYFSADFHNHATMHLIARMLELHDKTRFEIHAFSYGIDAGDPMRARLLRAVDAFHEVRTLSDPEVAALAREQAIDIALDLKGHTETGRPGIFACRAAPRQVNYLGYPGTMGADFIDYIIADRVVIPEDQQACYAERIVYLPNSYQATDDKHFVSEKVYSRSELGLPDDGFVFCCFNDNYKISRAEFDIWMRLLCRVENSVLWLLAGNPWAPIYLRREAEARGIDPARLVFGEKLPNAEHLARQRCADLFLDTFNVNAHTTANDALWAGLPVLTRIGSGFASRVAASLLHAIDLPDLITETAEDYERLALALATDPQRLAAVKARLVRNRQTAPLFDSARYTRAIEQLFEQIHAERVAEQVAAGIK